MKRLQGQSVGTLRVRQLLAVKDLLRVVFFIFGKMVLFSAPIRGGLQNQIQKVLELFHKQIFDSRRHNRQAFFAEQTKK